MIGIGRTRALAFLACISITARAGAQNLVDFGDTITDPGVYFLNGNQSGAGDGIKIDSDDVVLFLGRFTLRGNDSANGITVVEQERVTIWGGRITDFDDGIVMEESRYCTVRDCRIDSCDYGISLFEVDDSAFVRVRTDHNSVDGINAIECSDNRFFSVRSDGNGSDGIELGSRVTMKTPIGVLDGSHGNRFKKCWLAYNGDHGLHFIAASDNHVEENQCVANDNVGILLGTVNDGMDTAVGQGLGSDDNEVRGNWCPANGAGIVVEWGSTGNTLHDNIALASFEVDLYDGNAGPPCENTWYLNLFLTRAGAGALCIF